MIAPSRIRVVCRKRPLNQKEVAARYADVVDCVDKCVIVREPRLKVDLTKYVEEHFFQFDDSYTDSTSNEELYQSCVRPLVRSFVDDGTKCTCFAYGQTGSGKTYTMLGDTSARGDPTQAHNRGIFVLAAEELFDLLCAKGMLNRCTVFVSFYEIYCGKLYDLLNERQPLNARENAAGNVIVQGLQDLEVGSVEALLSKIDSGLASRTTGVTGANVDSSRSHAILSLRLSSLKTGLSPNPGSMSDSGSSAIVHEGARLSFIDLAGSERGADTGDQDRQTRLDGAEINKSLLALKECIRALDQQQEHTPFRGSKLTQVLKDSFTGNNCTTLMVANLSPSGGSVEHTLNTLRYAYRVKELRGNSLQVVSANPQYQVLAESRKERADREDQAVASTGMISPEPRASNSSLPVSTPTTRPPFNSSTLVVPTRKVGKQQDQNQNSAQPGVVSSNGAPAKTRASQLASTRSLAQPKQALALGKQSPFGSTRAQGENTIRVSEPTRGHSLSRTESNLGQQGFGKPELSFARHGLDPSRYSTPEGFQRLSKDLEMLAKQHDRLIGVILAQEEELIVKHREHLDSLNGVLHEETSHLSAIDQPGSDIDKYVTFLDSALSKKMELISSMRERLSVFQQNLVSEEKLSTLFQQKSAMANRIAASLYSQPEQAADVREDPGNAAGVEPRPNGSSTTSLDRLQDVSVGDTLPRPRVVPSALSEAEHIFPGVSGSRLTTTSTQAAEGPTLESLSLVQDPLSMGISLTESPSVTVIRDTSIPTKGNYTVIKPAGHNPTHLKVQSDQTHLKVQSDQNQLRMQASPSTQNVAFNSLVAALNSTDS